MKRILIAIILTVTITGCAKPSLTITQTRKGNDIIFNLEHSQINGILSLAVLDNNSGEQLWIVNYNYFNGTKISYGTVAAELNKPHNQIFPENNKKPKILRTGNEIKIIVGYQYDKWLTANVEYKEAIIVIK